ncbi:MAG: ribosome-associated translation inhibitor RaiA [Bacteroidaceae bacterium]|nr:ribosome-associated translation inhibitor RaiA [Bacteroidaceae bacterium]
MNITIKAIHFDVTEKLEQYIEKKLEKIAKTAGEDSNVEVTLKVVKPQTAMNKEVSITLPYEGKRLYAEKTADTFEDAVLQVIDSLRTQMEKIKNK